MAAAAKAIKLENVQFTTFSDTGTKSLCLGVEIERSRDDINADIMEQSLCGSRVEVTLTFNSGGDNEGGQQTMQDEKHEIGPVIAEIKHHKTTPLAYVFPMNFLLDDVDLKALREFRKKSGTLTLKRVGAIEETGGGGEGGE